jgi:HD-like signal output (HDOD) protein
MPTRQSAPGRYDDDAILAAARSLGVLGGSATAPRILAALCEPGATAAGIGRVISQEPGITARVLRVANSPYYGVTRAVGTLDRAVVILGLDAVRGVAAAACMDRNMLHGIDDAILDVDAMIRHSVATAAAAEALARRGHRAVAPDSFIAGLLHDMGTAIQARLNPGGMQRFLARAAALPSRASRSVEIEEIGVTHERCVAVLLSAWRLPQLLTDAVRFHHEPLGAPPESRKLAALVELGHDLSIGCGIGFGPETVAVEPPTDVLALLAISTESIQQVAAELPERVAQLQAALAG